ncbi:MAG: FecCD family ABC transporter permease [Oscillospiraceae bacterium]
MRLHRKCFHRAERHADRRFRTLLGERGAAGISNIIANVRLPRVLCVALTGASLSVCGAAMQGLLKNPLADGSTLGVSSGASLGAVISIAFGITLPGIPLAGTMSMAMLFAFLSLVVILGLAYRLDGSLSTGTIILIGVIYSMFVSSVLSLVITFAPDKVQSITFWTMGSLAGQGVCPRPCAARRARRFRRRALRLRARAQRLCRRRGQRPAYRRERPAR